MDQELRAIPGERVIVGGELNGHVGLVEMLLRGNTEAGEWERRPMKE